MSFVAAAAASMKRPRDDLTISTDGIRTTDEGEAALAKYELGDVLGHGAFAVVRLVTRKADGLEFAMKLVDADSTDAVQAEFELDILRLLGMHRNIVSLIDHFVLPDASVFVLELADGGEVFEKICEDGAYSEKDAATVIRQCALALAFMHSIGVAHRDLKPENLLLTSTNEVKVADFGLAARCGEGQPPLNEVCGTVSYIAPEILAAGRQGGKPYGVEVDLFALGGVLFALLGAYVAFDPTSSLTDDEVMRKVEAADWSFNDFPDQWSAVSEGAKELITRMLEHNPSKRITADQLLREQWVSGETADENPLPGSDAQLRNFNNGRRVWRAAVQAAAVFANLPPAAVLEASEATSGDGGAGAASSSGGSGKAKKGGKSKSSAASKGKEKKKPLPPLIQAELRAAFELFDIDGNGEIDAEEMKQVVRSLGANEGESSRILLEADVDGDGKVSFDEFVEMVRPLYDDSGAALRKAFEMFDLDKSGYIDRSELSVMLRKLGFGYQGCHVFESADSDGDGKVSYSEFLSLFGKAAEAKGGPGGKAKVAAAKGAAKKRKA